MDSCSSAWRLSLFSLSAILTVLLQRLGGASAQAQYGSHFIVAMPYALQNNSSNIRSTSDLYLVLTNPGSTDITVIVTKNGNSLASINVETMKTVWHNLGGPDDFMLPEADGVSSDRSLDVRETSGEPFGLMVTGTKAYDGYLAIPVDEWGKAYTVATFCWGSGAVCQIVILASTDSTQVTLKLPAENHTFSAKDPYKNSFAPAVSLTKTLQKNDAWVVTRPFEMTGAEVTSDAPVGVLAGAQWTSYKGSGGAVNEQLPPVTALGKEYVSFDKATVRCVTTEPETTLHSSDHPAVHIARKDEWLQGAYDGPVYFRADRPILTVLLGRGRKTPNDSSFPIFVVLTPVPQFSDTDSKALVPTSFPFGALDLVVTMRAKTEQHVSVPITATTQTVIPRTDYVVDVYKGISGTSIVVKTDPPADHTDVIGLYVVWVSADTAFTAPLAARYNVINQEKDCSLEGQPGDTVDNDCDGEVDEDECNGGGIDCKRPSDLRDSWGRTFVAVIPHFLNSAINVEVRLGLTTLATSPVNVNIGPPDGSPTVTVTLSDHTDAQIHHLSTEESSLVSGYRSTRVANVTSDQAISIMYFAADVLLRTSGSMRLIPVDSLGKEYRVFTLCETAECMFQVVGVHPDTYIDIHLKFETSSCTLAFEGNSYVHGDVVRTNVTVHEALSLSSSCDMTGSLVAASKPVAVFSFSEETELKKYHNPASYKDYFMEQLPPIESYGKTFILKQEEMRSSVGLCSLIPTTECTDMVFVVASEVETEVQIANSSLTAVSRTLDSAGEVLQHRFNDNFLQITSSQPVLVVHVTLPYGGLGGGGGAMVVVTPVSQFANRDILPFPGFFNSKGSPDHQLVVVLGGESVSSNVNVDGNMYTPTETSVSTVFNMSDLLVNYTIDGTHVLTEVNTASSARFGGYIGYYHREQGLMATSLAQSLNHIFQKCTMTKSLYADTIDNDCDGSIDEEPCNTTEPRDVDGDGRFNEDCQTAPEELTSSYTPIGTTVTASATISTSLVSSTSWSCVDDTSAVDGTATAWETTLASTFLYSRDSSLTTVASITTPTSSLTTTWSCVDDSTLTPSLSPSPTLTETSWSSLHDSTASLTLPESTVEETSLLYDSSYLYSSFVDVASSSMKEAVISSSLLSSTAMSTPSSSVYESSMDDLTLISMSLDPSSVIVNPVHSDQFSFSASSSSDSVSSSFASAYSGLHFLMHASNSQLSATVFPSSTPAFTTTTTTTTTTTPTIKRLYNNSNASVLLTGSPGIASSSSSSSSSPLVHSATPFSPCVSPDVYVHGTCFPSSVTTTVTTNAPSSITASSSSGISASNLCGCNCRPWQPTAAVDSESLTSVLSSIVQELSVEKSTLSAVRRKKVSAPDDRPSAQTVGYFGVAIICGIGLGIIVLDAGALYRDVKNLIDACKRT